MMKEKILFMGTPPIARTMLERLVSEGYEIVGVLTQPDRRVGRKKQLQCSAVKEYALQQGLPIWQPARIRDDHEELLKVEMDLIVTCAYGQFVPQALLDHPRFGAVNLHASLLPKLRGAAPIQRAIMRGDKECGMSVMRMVKKMDAGAVMAQRALRIEEEDTSGTLFEKLAVLGADLMASSLPLIFAGEADFVEQDEEQVSFAPAITPQEERLDLCKGLDAVYDQARALIPQPCGYIMPAGKKVKLHAVRRLHKAHDLAEGTCAGMIEHGFAIALQGGYLLADVLQPEGKKPMDAASFYNGSGKQWVGSRVE